MLLATMLVNFIPITAKALSDKDKEELNTSVRVDTLSNFFKDTEVLVINDKPSSTNASGYDLAYYTKLDLSNASIPYLLGIARGIMNLSKDAYNKDFDAVEIAGIEKAFGLKAIEDASHSELGTLRDMCIGMAAYKIKNNPDVIQGSERDIAKFATVLMSDWQNMQKLGEKDGGINTACLVNQFSFNGCSDVAAVFENIMANAQKEQVSQVKKESMSSLKTEWDDTDKYDSTRRAVLFLTDKDAESPCKVEVVIGAKDYYGVDNNSRDKYVNNLQKDDQNGQILNSIIWTMLHDNSIFGNQTKNVAILSLILQRGSAYSYATNKIGHIDGQLQLTKSNKGPEIKAQLTQLDKDIKSVLERSGLDKPSERILYTVGLRMQYAFYAMQSNEELPNDVATTMSLQEDEDYSLRLLEPMLITNPNISNLEGYTMLNNVANEIAWTGKVTLPTLGKITSKEGLSANTKTQLRFLRSAYDAWIFMRDKSQAVPKEALNSIDKAWSQSVTLDDGSKTSLKETYERLSQFIDLSDSIFEDTVAGGKPLKNFFDSATMSLSKNLKYGIALSASYMPFKTNVYETVTYKKLVGEDEFFNFHVLYGYYRKPLYIDTNISSVSENYMSGKVGNLKLATLKDILECEKEITLYTDDNFYNIDQLKNYKDEAIQREDKDSALSSAIKSAGTDVDKIAKEYIKAKAEEIEKSLVDKIKDASSVDLNQVLKTGEYEKYPAKMNQVADYETSKKSVSKEKMEEVLLTGKDIDVYLGNGDDNQIDDPSYNIMRAYAVTSGIARDHDVLNLCNTAARQPVFKSSKGIAKIKEAPLSWKSAVINYVILKNAKENMSVSYSSNLDLNKPVYMDIYGNILTESGFVVIPAASNATLNSTYEPYNAGFLTVYGKTFSLDSEYEDFIVDSPIHGVLAIDKEGKQFDLQGTQQGSTDVIDLSSVILSDENRISDLVNVYAENLDENLDTRLYIANVVLEVLRGAPLESIDKIKEGITIGNTIGDNGIEQAAKLELFQDNFLGKHEAAILSLPNIAFFSGIEYLIPLLLKVIIIGVMLMTFKYVYILGVKRRFSLGAVAKYFAVLTLTLAMIYVIPKFFNFCYYWSNKSLLQEESLVISMLNYEKEQAGLEVGIRDVTEVKNKTVLYLKMKDLDIPWYTVFHDISLSPVTESLTKLYTKYAEKDLAFRAKDFKFVAGDLYISIDDLLNATTITFNPTYKSMYDVTTQETPASFYTPYYVFLKDLTVDVNQYNAKNNIFSYSAQTYRDGKLKSLGLIKAFMESPQFTDDKDETDILHLRTIYGKDNLSDENSILRDKALEQARASNWCNVEITDDQFNERYQKLNRRAKKFVAEHRDLIGRISDETFLKMMALDLAIYHNRYFNLDNANSLDIFNIASEDLARLAMVPKDEVIVNSPLSFARFTYEEGGEVSVYFSTILLVLFFLNSWISPIVTILVFVAIFSSLFMRKIIFESEDDSIKGYFYIALYMGGTCWAYALFMKGTTLFSQLGFTPAVNTLLLIIVHIAIILMMLFIGAVVILNWRDLGSAQFSETTMKIGHIMKAIAGSASRMTSKVGEGVLEGRDKLRELTERRRKREEELKRRNLYERGRTDYDVMDDSKVNRFGKGPKLRYEDDDIERSSNRRRIEYEYSGGNRVRVYTNKGVENIDLQSFLYEYGFKPKVNVKGRDLSDRLRDKFDDDDDYL